MKPANYAPIYCALYPQLAEIARSHGYALAVHGSMARDFDLICIPWVDSESEQPTEPDEVVESITNKFAVQRAGNPSTKPHGRLCYTLIVGFGECFLDLSFMPIVEQEVQS